MLDGPVKADVAVLIGKIERLCQQIPHLRSECATARSRKLAAAERVQSWMTRKQELKAQLHLKLTSDGASAPASHAKTLRQYSSKLAVVDAQLHHASAKWNDLVWAHTLAATALDEAVDAKHAMNGQLVGVLTGVEAAKEQRLMELWKSITLADLDWQHDALY